MQTVPCTTQQRKATSSMSVALSWLPDRAKWMNAKIAFKLKLFSLKFTSAISKYILQWDVVWFMEFMSNAETFSEVQWLAGTGNHRHVMGSVQKVGHQTQHSCTESTQSSVLSCIQYKLSCSHYPYLQLIRSRLHKSWRKSNFLESRTTDSLKLHTYTISTAGYLICISNVSVFRYSPDMTPASAKSLLHL